MWPPKHQLHNRTLLTVLVLLTSIFLVPLSATASFSRALDETLVPQPQEPNAGMKCSVCPCTNPCGQQILPPPPPTPPPPPPPLFPSSQYCPPQAVTLPPPPPRFIYFTGPPPPRFIYFTSPQGNLYPTDPYDLAILSAAGWNNVVSLLALVGCGLLQVLAIWSL